MHPQEHKSYQRMMRKNEIAVELHGDLKLEKQAEFEAKQKLCASPIQLLLASAQMQTRHSGVQLKPDLLR